MSLFENVFGKYYHSIVWYYRTKSVLRYNLFYRKCAKQDIDKNKVILFSPNYDFMDSSFNCLYSELQKKNFSIIIINNHHNNQKNIEHFISEAATASYIFCSDNSRLIDYIQFRKETKIICLWHACGALKKFGNSKAKYWKRDSFFKRLFFFYKNFDVFTVSSQKCLPFYSEATGISLKKGVLKATGISRTDIFFDKNFLTNCQQKKLKMTTKKILLYAPTFRGKNFAEAYTPEFIDFEKLREHFSNDYIILVNRHPGSLNKPYFIPESCRDFVFDISTKYDISELIVMSDILIGDYSSLVFEWSLFGKPFLPLTPDLDNYKDGFYIDFESMIEKCRCNNTQDLIAAIQSIDKYDFSFLNVLKNDFMSSCDGHSTERLLNFLLSDR